MMKVPLRLEERGVAATNLQRSKGKCVSPEVSTLVTFDYSELSKLYLNAHGRSGKHFRDLHWW